MQRSLTIICITNLNANNMVRNKQIQLEHRIHMSIPILDREPGDVDQQQPLQQWEPKRGEPESLIKNKLDNQKLQACNRSVPNRKPQLTRLASLNILVDLLFNLVNTQLWLLWCSLQEMRLLLYPAYPSPMAHNWLKCRQLLLLKFYYRRILCQFE